MNLAFLIILSLAILYVIAPVHTNIIPNCGAYNVQSTMLEEYHNTKADVLYRSYNTWEKATYKNQSTNNKTKNTLKPYYTMVNKDEKNEIGLIQIYTPESKQNLISYLVGTTDGSSNKLKLYKFLKNEKDF